MAQTRASVVPKQLAEIDVASLAGGETVANAALPTKKCLAIANRLGDVYLDGLPYKLQDLVKRLKQGLVAKGKRHLEPEKATAILGKALREIGADLHRAAREAQEVVDVADADRESRVAAVEAAAAEIARLRKAVVQGGQAVKDALKNIDGRKAAISEAKAARQSEGKEAKKVHGRKRQLEELEKETYSPLKIAPAEGLEGRKRLAGLKRAGKVFDFHAELLTVAPSILRKQLDARRTFDGLIVEQLGKEFEKNSTALEANIKICENRVLERASDVRAAEEAAADAKHAHKVATQELAASEASIRGAQQALIEARRRVQRLPADLKRAVRTLGQAEARLLKFQRGPRAAFQRALGQSCGDLDILCLGDVSVPRITDVGIDAAPVADTHADTSDSDGAEDAD